MSFETPIGTARFAEARPNFTDDSVVVTLELKLDGKEFQSEFGSWLVGPWAVRIENLGTIEVSNV